MGEEEEVEVEVELDGLRIERIDGRALWRKNYNVSESSYWGVSGNEEGELQLTAA